MTNNILFEVVKRFSKGRLYYNSNGVSISEPYKVNVHTKKGKYYLSWLGESIQEYNNLSDLLTELDTQRLKLLKLLKDVRQKIIDLGNIEDLPKYFTCCVNYSDGSFLYTELYFSKGISLHLSCDITEAIEVLDHYIEVIQILSNSPN